MLTIHGGRARRLWPRLLSSVAEMRAQGVRCVLIVPEQFTLQAERSLMEGLSLPGFFDIEVVSYSRFVERLFQQYSGGRVRIDQNGKNIAMARAVLACQKELTYYARAAQRRGFVARSGEWVADMKRAEVSPQRLAEYANGLPEGAYREKLRDLAALYAAYDGLLQGKFVDGEDALARAIESVEISGAVRDTAIYVYGFDMITDDFARLLCAVTCCCREAHVWLVMDREEAPDGDRFQPVRDSAERLRARLREAGLRREWLWEKPSPLDAPKDICWLEQNLLRPAPVPCGEAPANISLFEAATPYAEAHAVAQQAVRLMRGGMAAEDICILCGNLQTYRAPLESALQAYGLPYYVAAKEPLLSHGLAKLLLSALRCVTDGYRREDVIALLKSGFAPLSQDQCWHLEAYAERFSISGSRWRAPFTRGSEEERLAPEEARKALIPLLEKLQGDLRAAKTGAESLRAPVELLLTCGAYDTLLRQERELVEAGMDAEVLRARQVWGRVLSLLDQLHEIAGDARIPGRAMVSLLEAGLLENEISALPPTAGQISVGEIGNLLPAEPRALFACGLDSGMLAGSEGGLLEEDEQLRAAEGLGVYLGMDGSERDLMADLDLWKALSAPREKLYLSYAQASQGGAAQRPAPVIASVRRLFPRLVALGGVTDGAGSLHPLSPRQALEEIGARIRNHTLNDEWTQAYAWLMRSPEYRPQMTALLDAMQPEAPEALPPQLARRLFTDRILSVTRLESYAACPYSHFVQYGLRPQEQRVWGVDSRERGEFFHAAMEGFTRALPENAAWPRVTRKECDEMMDAALRPLTAAWEESAVIDTARARAEAKRYVNVCRRVAWAFTRGAAQSSFRPSRVEVAFGYPGGPPPLSLELPDGERVLVRGRIDRVDRFDSGEAVYLRVVDYKSGDQRLDPAKIYVGMQLQLLLYLEAALQTDPGALPAGAFYQWMGDPLVDQEKKAAIESELAKRLCLKGVMLSDVQVARWMDSGEPPLGIEDVFKKDGTPRKGKLVCTLEELTRLIGLAHETAVRLTQEIRRGGIAAAPVADKGNAVHCSCCAFAGVCRRDPRARAQDRPLPRMSLEELLSARKPE